MKTTSIAAYFTRTPPAWFSLAAWNQPRKKCWVKSFALGLILSFLFPYMTWAFEGPGAAGSGALEIPVSLGTVLAAQEGSGPLIVHIQDLHCNYEVQGNIAALIGHLVQKRGLSLVAVEGASLPINVTKLATVPDPAIRRKAADFFMRQGRITGPEFYAVTGERPIALEGAETPELYRQNWEAMTRFLNDESQGLVCDLREALLALKPAVYSPALRAWDVRQADYRAGRTAVWPYARQLAAAAARARLDLAAYPNLAVYAAGSSAAVPEAVESDRLLAEIDALELALREPLYASADERELDARLRRLEIVERLVNISATPEDLAAFRAAPAAYRFEDFQTYLKGHGEESDLLMAEDAAQFDRFLAEAERFYLLADRRSGAFCDNLLARLGARNERLAVLVTGGFHTEKIVAELRRRGVPVVAVKPRLTRPDVVNPYFAFLRGRKTPLEKLLNRNQDTLATASNFLQTPDPAAPVDESRLGADQRRFYDAGSVVVSTLGLSADLRAGLTEVAALRAGAEAREAGYPCRNPEVAPWWERLRINRAARVLVAPFRLSPRAEREALTAVIEPRTAADSMPAASEAATVEDGSQTATLTAPLSEEEVRAALNPAPARFSFFAWLGFSRTEAGRLSAWTAPQAAWNSVRLLADNALALDRDSPRAQNHWGRLGLIAGAVAVLGGFVLVLNGLLAGSLLIPFELGVVLLVALAASGFYLLGYSSLAANRSPDAWEAAAGRVSAWALGRRAWASLTDWLDNTLGRAPMTPAVSFTYGAAAEVSPRAPAPLSFSSLDAEIGYDYQQGWLRLEHDPAAHTVIYWARQADGAWKKYGSEQAAVWAIRPEREKARAAEPAKTAAALPAASSEGFFRALGRGIGDLLSELAPRQKQWGIQFVLSNPAPAGPDGLDRLNSLGYAAAHLLFPGQSVRQLRWGVLGLAVEIPALVAVGLVLAGSGALGVGVFAAVLLAFAVLHQVLRAAAAFRDQAPSVQRLGFAAFFFHQEHHYLRDAALQGVTFLPYLAAPIAVVVGLSPWLVLAAVLAVAVLHILYDQGLLRRAGVRYAGDEVERFFSQALVTLGITLAALLPVAMVLLGLVTLLPGLALFGLLAAVAVWAWIAVSRPLGLERMERIGPEAVQGSRARRAQIRRLLPEIDRELTQTGSGQAPTTILISDMHGNVTRFTALLSDALTEIWGSERLGGVPITLDPNYPFEPQLNARGLSLRFLPGVITVGGDILDRGEDGAKCFLRFQEMVRVSPYHLRYVMGNHDAYASAALEALHLPWYDGYNFHGDRTAADLVAAHPLEELLGRAALTAAEKKLWWAQKLAEYSAEQKRYEADKTEYSQEEIDLGLVKLGQEAKAARGVMIDSVYAKYAGRWSGAELDVWEDFLGYFARIKVDKPYLGLNGIGKTSESWWQDVHARMLAARRARGALPDADPEELKAWDEALELCGRIWRSSQIRERRALERGEWWYRVFESLNSQAYQASIEWAAKDWVEHKGWGEAIMAELTKMGTEGMEVTPANYLLSPTLQTIGRFYRDYAALYLRTPMGDLITHSWLPVEKDGQIALNYDRRNYQNREVFELLDLLAEAIRRSEDTGSLVRAMDFINGWYSEKVTRIKPEDIKKYHLLIEVTHQALGILNWLTGHNQLTKLQRPFITRTYYYTHAETDHGMSLDTLGGYVLIGPRGIRMRGYQTVDDPVIRESPDTIAKGKAPVANPPLDGRTYLVNIRGALLAELDEIEAKLATERPAPLTRVLEFTRRVGPARLSILGLSLLVVVFSSVLLASGTLVGMAVGAMVIGLVFALGVFFWSLELIQIAGRAQAALGPFLAAAQSPLLFLDAEEAMARGIRAAGKSITVALTTDNGQTKFVVLPDPGRVGDPALMRAVYRRYLGMIYAQGWALGNGPTGHLYVEVFGADPGAVLPDLTAEVQAYFNQTGAPLLSKVNGGRPVQVQAKPAYFKPQPLPETAPGLETPERYVSLGFDLGGQGTRLTVLIDGRDVTEELFPEAPNEIDALRAADKSLRYRYAFPLQTLEAGGSGEELQRRLVAFVLAARKQVEAKTGRKVEGVFVNVAGTRDPQSDRMSSLGQISRGFGEEEEMARNLAAANQFIPRLREALGGEVAFGYDNDMSGWTRALREKGNFVNGIAVMDGSGVGTQRMHDGRPVTGAREQGHGRYNLQERVESRAADSPRGSFEDWAGSIRGIMGVARTQGFVGELERRGVKRPGVKQIGWAAAGLDIRTGRSGGPADPALQAQALAVWDEVERREAEQFAYLHLLTGETQFALGGGTTVDTTGPIRLEALQRHLAAAEQRLHLPHLTVTLVPDLGSYGAALQAARLVKLRQDEAAAAAAAAKPAAKTPPAAGPAAGQPGGGSAATGSLWPRGEAEPEGPAQGTVELEPLAPAAEAPAVNRPYLFSLPLIFRAFPFLHRWYLRSLYDRLTLLAAETPAGRPDLGALNANPMLIAMKLHYLIATPLDARFAQRLPLKVLAQAASPRDKYLGRAVLTGEEADNLAGLELAGEVLAPLVGNQAADRSPRGLERQQLAARILANQLAYQGLQHYYPRGIFDRMGWRTYLDREFTAERPERDAEVAPALAGSVPAAEYYRPGRQVEHVNLTGAELAGAALGVLREAEALLGEPGRADPVLAEFAAQWQDRLGRGELPSADALLAVLVHGRISQPALVFLRGLLLASQRPGLSPQARRVMQAGVAQQVLRLAAESRSEAESGGERRAARAAAAAVETAPREGRGEVWIMGLPAEESAGLLAAVDRALEALADRTDAAGVRQRLLAVRLGLTAGQGRAAGRLTSVPTREGQALASVLAAVVAREALGEDVAALGESFQQQTFVAAAGVRAVELAPGQVVALPTVLEVQSVAAGAGAAEVRGMVAGRRFASGVVPRVYRPRLETAPLSDRLPGWLGVALIGVAELRLGAVRWPGFLRVWMHRVAQAVSPLSYLRHALRDLDPALQKEFLDVHSPLYLSYARAVRDPSPRARLVLVKSVIWRIRGSAGDERSEASAWLDALRFFDRLGSLPKAEGIVTLTPGDPFWDGLAPDLRGAALSLPAVLIGAAGSKGALGYAVTRLQAGDHFAVDERVLNLFLRRGLRMSFSVSA